MKISDITPARIKKLRESRRINVEQFSKELGCSERYLNYRESGERPIKKLFALAVIGYLTITGGKNGRKN